MSFVVADDRVRYSTCMDKRRLLYIWDMGSGILRYGYLELYPRNLEGILEGVARMFHP